jgi:hypothetical protein
MGRTKFNGRKGFGTRSSELGVIERAVELNGCARIILERETRVAPFAITCGISGWMVHKRFFGTEQEAEEEFATMNADLARIVGMVPLQSDPHANLKSQSLSQAITEFMRRYP